MRMFIWFFNDQKGATSIEYALVATGIALAIIGAVNGLGLKLGTTYENVRAALQ